ncbi:MAG: sugar ABC transporter substrate-binding protein, partial [Propionibacteriaceae bacterium]|nr:sugar ABC transporter substrate-binding protein [Propionibacteriaceae bacterium]
MKDMAKCLVAGAAAISLLLAGCSSSGSGNQDSNTIVWNMWAGSSENVDNLNAQMKIAQDIVGSDIKIELQTAPWADFFTKLNANMASGKVSCVTAMNGQRMSGYYQAFMELDDGALAKAGISKDDYDPSALEVM